MKWMMGPTDLWSQNMAIDTLLFFLCHFIYQKIKIIGSHYSKEASRYNLRLNLWTFQYNMWKLISRSNNQTILKYTKRIKTTNPIRIRNVVVMHYVFFFRSFMCREKNNIQACLITWQKHTRLKQKAYETIDNT